VKNEFSDSDVELAAETGFEAAKDLALVLGEWASGSCRSRRRRPTGISAESIIV